MCREGLIVVELKNYMEQLVWEQLNEFLAVDASVCKCEKCRYDMAALALSRMMPHYVVSAKGETFTRMKTLELQFQIDVMTAILQAAQTVKSRPHHG